MQSAAVKTGWRERVRNGLEAADAFFLADAVRRRSATDLARARVGIVGCFAHGAAFGLVAAVLSVRAPWPLVAGIAIAGAASGVLPFLLRRTESIRSLGHVVCGELLLLAGALLLVSGGRGTGILKMVPFVPLVALLMLGRRGVVAWSLAAGAVALAGFGLAAGDAVQTSPRFEELPPLQVYPITLVSLAMMSGIAVLFEQLWRRSDEEFAERSRSELALREELHRTLLEHASEGILVLDRDGHVQFASAAAERLMGIEPGRLIGRRLRRLTDAAGIRETSPVWQQALRQPGERIRMELRSTIRPRNLLPGQPPPHFEMTITNCLDHPAVRGVVVHIHDMSDLARTKANYQNLVEQSIQGIAVICRRRVVYANPALARLYGRPLESMIGQTVEETLSQIHPDDVPALLETMKSAPRPCSTPMELRVLRGDDLKWIWVQIRWADATWEGQRAHQFAYVDVTAQKELEAARRLEQEELEARIAERTRELELSQRSLHAQERLAAVGTLAAGVAHQINNPVGGILAAADYALVTTGDEDHAHVAHAALQEIRGQAIRCGKIIRSILQFSRSRPTEKWSGDLVSVLRTAVDVTRRVAREHSARVDLVIDRAVAKSTVLMSPIELEQVFVNLIVNAIQAQPFGAEVRVTARQVDHEIRVRVEDDGPGVPPEDRDRIFDPFFTTRLKGGGTGLGLSVAHSIIADHGGRMELVPTRLHPDRHACFEVTLPIEKTESGVPATAA